IISPKLCSGNCEKCTKLFVHIEALFPFLPPPCAPGRNLLTAVCFYGIIIGVAAMQRATVAQPVEQLTRNEQVVRSNRISSSSKGSEAVFTASGLFFFVQARTAHGSAGIPPGSTPKRPAARSRAGPAAGWPAKRAGPPRPGPSRPGARAAARTAPETGAGETGGRPAEGGKKLQAGIWCAPAAGRTPAAG